MIGFGEVDFVIEIGDDVEEVFNCWILIDVMLVN